MDVNPNFHKLTCIQFPGVVQNPNKAIECLGGLRVISKACETHRGFLEINFRPTDPFCKPALSTFNETTGLLIKVRVKKKKALNGDVSSRRVISTNILGIVHEVYSFQTLIDYQYLPLAPSEETSPNEKLKCILNDIYPSSIPTMDWIEKSTPYFFVPPIFSRMTAPQFYSFNNTCQVEAEPESNSASVMIRSRKSRSNFAHYICFNHTDPVPTEPKKQAREIIKKDNQYLKRLQEVFNEKPIRGRMELEFVTDFPTSELKIMLAAVGYNYINGPWRGLWVKLGYDPRKDPQSRIWQCIDYRLKALNILFRKRKNINYSFTRIKDGRPNVRKSITDDISDVMDERLYIFKPDVLPIKTQTFYQFCHIFVPEIQEMFANLGEVLPGALCHEKRGWLPSGFYKQCRLIMSKYTLLKLKESGLSNQNVNTEAGTSSQNDENQRDDILMMDDDEDVGPLMDYDEYEDDAVFPESDIEEYSDV